ncbi:MAG: Oxidoreductase molybdopterin binding domain protein [Pelotomaculum sp. PtaU1.Bin065]|nr:MAG: Oxidoreductase molybdopterin binding domain protein [Pelotomaculum sp. PtaU1.Bin065]
MAKIKEHCLNKILTGLVALCVICGCLAAAAPRASAAEEIALTIKGNGVNNTVQFTMDQLKALPQKTYDYSGYNYYPSLQVFKNTTGVTLQTLFELAGGLKDNATMIKVKTPTSPYNYYTKRDLMDLPRYYFPAGEDRSDCPDWPPTTRGSEEGAVPVETMIAFIEGGKLIYGQQTPLEPTCCKGEQMNGILPGCTIEVTTEPLPQWDMPWAEPDSGTVVPGTKVKLHYGDDSLYHTRIYYTLDGSEPTVKSNIFNISYPTFRPWFNKPIPITGDITIKTRAIGLGALDSEVRTFHYNLGALACTVEGAGITTPINYAVETLKTMTQTQGTYQCGDNGQTVTLNAKGLLLSDLLEQLSVSERWKVTFISAGGEEYDGGTVQELADQRCLLAYEVDGQEVNDVSGGQTVKIQILRNSGDLSANRLRYFNTIKLVNVDDEVTINQVRLLDHSGQAATSAAPGGGYCVEAKLINDVNAAKDTFLIIQVRAGEGAGASGGGAVVGYTATQTVVDVDGCTAKAEFTLPESLSGKAYVDVFVWDNPDSHNPLGNSNHDVNFTIQ